MKREFYVVIERDEDGVFIGEVPQLRGCYTQGKTLARIFHELLSRDHEDGRATWQLVPRYRGIGSEAYLNGTSQVPTPEDARKDGHIRGRSK